MGAGGGPPWRLWPTPPDQAEGLPPLEHHATEVLLVHQMHVTCVCFPFELLCVCTLCHITLYLYFMWHTSSRMHTYFYILS